MNKAQLSNDIIGAAKNAYQMKLMSTPGPQQKDIQPLDVPALFFSLAFMPEDELKRLHAQVVR